MDLCTAFINRQYYRRLEIAGSGNITVTAAAAAPNQKLTFGNRRVTGQSVLLGVRHTFGG